MMASAASAGDDQRQGDPPEDLELAGAVDPRRVEHLLRQRQEILAHEEDADRIEQRRHDHRDPRVGELQIAGDQDELRDDHHEERHGQRRDDDREQHVAPEELEAGEGVAGHARQEQRGRREQRRRDDAVEQRRGRSASAPASAAQLSAKDDLGQERHASPRKNSDSGSVE